MLPGDNKKDKSYAPRKKGDAESSDSDADAEFVPGSDGFEKDSSSDEGSEEEGDAEGESGESQPAKKIKKVRAHRV